MNGDVLDPEKLIPQVLRSLAASGTDTAQRSHVAAMEMAEMAAWDAFALAWISERSKNMNVEPALAPDREGSPADFADKMIDRRRKYFGIEVGSVTVASSPSVGTTVATPPRKPET